MAFHGPATDAARTSRTDAVVECVHGETANEIFDEQTRRARDLAMKASAVVWTTDATAPTLPVRR